MTIDCPPVRYSCMPLARRTERVAGIDAARVIVAWAGRAGADSGVDKRRHRTHFRWRAPTGVLAPAGTLRPMPNSAAFVLVGVWAQFFTGVPGAGGCCA